MEKVELKAVLDEYFANVQYEYQTIVLNDTRTGSIDQYALNATLEKYSKNGWRLKFALSNELGVNKAGIAVAGIGAGVNSTIDQTILIFERNVNFKKTVDDDTEQKEFFVVNYSPTVLLRVNSVDFYFNGKKSFARLSVNNRTRNIIKSIRATIEIENIFGEKLVFDNVIFTELNEVDEEFSLFRTEQEQLDATVNVLKGANLCRVYIRQYILGNNETVNCKDDYVDVENSEEVLDLKRVLGQDVVHEYQDLGDKGWSCLCGIINSNEDTECIACSRTRARMMNAGVITMDEIIERAETMKNGREIYDFISSNSKIMFSDEVMENLKSVANGEKAFGNMKDSMLKKLRALQNGERI